MIGPPTNPPRNLVFDDGRKGMVLQLKSPACIDDLTWDGPVYATILNYVTCKVNGPGQTNVFMEEESIQRLGFVVKIDFLPPNALHVEDETLKEVLATDYKVPWHWFQHQHMNLADELTQGRPLLLLYRFLRVKKFFLLVEDSVELSDAEPQYRLVESPVYLNVQVISYSPRSRATYIDVNGAPIKPSWWYVVHASVRCAASTAAPDVVNVIIPTPYAWESRISREEFITGWCHGVPRTSRPQQRAQRFLSQ